MSAATSRPTDPLDILARLTDLTALPQWVLWRLEANPNKPKPDKVPYNPRTGRRAATDKPTTWCTYAEAVAALKHRPGKYNGLGFVFSENGNLHGVDFDGVRDPDLGEIDPAALAWVRRANTYAEISQSGRGLHLIGRGALPPGGRRRGNVEMYDSGRFFALTGNALPDAPLAISDCAEVVAELHRDTFKPQAASSPTRAAPIHTVVAGDDDELLRRALKAANGDKLRRLIDGDLADHAGDHSAADLALCNLLAFWTQDADQIDRIFRRSGLMRPKWERQDYRDATIGKALDDVGETYRGNGHAGAPQSALHERPPADEEEAPPESIGAAGPSRSPKTAEYVRVLADLGYSFRLNLCGEEIEINGERLTDPLESVVRTKLRDAGYPHVNIARDAYVAEAWRNRYHPVIEYLKTRRWDGADHFARLAAYVTCTPLEPGLREGDDGDPDVFALWFRRWAIGAVARVMLGGVQNRMLVWEGQQNIGKSHLARWLASPLPDMYVEAPINPDDKDCDVRLMSVWVWEVAELGATTRKADREALKHFISKQIVRVRKAYGRYDTVRPALASFIGTVNNESGFLSDPTGYRRFMVAPIESIDWDYSKDLDPNQIWAQAYALFVQGEKWDLSANEAWLAERLSRHFEIEDYLEARIDRLFDINPRETAWFTTTDDIIAALDRDGTRENPTALARRVAAILKQRGIAGAVRRIPPGGKQYRGWVGVRRLGA